MKLFNAVLTWLCLSVLLLPGPVTVTAAVGETDEAAAGSTKQTEDWVKRLGGVLNAEGAIGAHGRRGLFVTKAVAAGQDIALLPESVIMNLGSTTGSILTPILTYLREQLSPCSRFKPYITAIRPQDAVMNACSLPVEHVKLLQSPFWEQHVDMWRNFLHRAWTGEMRQELEFTVQEMLGDVNVTLEQVQQACAVVTSRYVKSERNRLILCPIFDLANQRDNCSTYLGRNEVGALRMIAGEDLKVGDEVCYPYSIGSLRPDHGVFYYGFIPDLVGPPQLLLVDHKNFTGKDGEYELPDAPFSGSPEEVEAEIARLTSILQPLEAVPAPSRKSDSEENHAYNLMVDLRARRVAALEYEVARLQDLIKEGLQEEL